MNDIKEIFTDSISALIKNSTCDLKIASLEKRQKKKLHFIPYKYRIFGGILQSMNIQFGNFIEKVFAEALSRNEDIELINSFAKKSNTFVISENSDKLIDSHITDCQLHNYSDIQLNQNFKQLISAIKTNEADPDLNTEKFANDVDLLFKDKRSGIYYYGEIKYNDEIDTEEYVDINCKVLKTFACMQRILGINIELQPILIYYSNIKLNGNIYLPEDMAIYRGKRFFDTFTNIEYSELDACMKNISESPETIKIFDDLYKRIVT